MIPIKRKVELALQAFLSGTPGLGDAPVLAGHRAGTRTLPCVVVYGEKANENDDFPPGTGVFDVQVKVFVLTQADDEDITAQDDRVEAIRVALYDSARLRAALNAPASSHDHRVVRDFHLYDLIETSCDEGRDDRHFGEVLNYTAICQGVDGPA